MVRGVLYRLNFPNGKAYVGITKNTALERFASHVSFAKTGKRLGAVHHAILKYGPESVTVETLGSASDWSTLTQMEAAAIVSENCKFPHGYNLTDGGEGTIGVVRSAETRAKHSAAKKGRVPDRAHLEKAWAASRGRIKTPEECAKLSAANKGKKKSPEHIEKMRAPNTGKKLSDEAKAKVSAANKGKTFSDETRARISAACAAKWAERKRAAALTE